MRFLALPSSLLSTSLCIKRIVSFYIVTLPFSEIYGRVVKHGSIFLILVFTAFALLVKSLVEY